MSDITSKKPAVPPVPVIAPLVRNSSMMSMKGNEGNKSGRTVSMATLKKEPSISSLQQRTLAREASRKSMGGKSTSRPNLAQTKIIIEEEEPCNLPGSINRAELRELFNVFDADGGGEIDRAEMMQLFRTLGVKKPEAEINKMIDDIDLDGNGVIDFNEFCSVMSKAVTPAYSQSDVKNAFALFQDPENPGWIAPRHMERVIMARCDPASVVKAQTINSEDSVNPGDLCDNLIVNVVGEANILRNADGDEMFDFIKLVDLVLAGN